MCRSHVTLMIAQGNISEWKIEEGQELAAGDVIAEIETDKATMDWESQVFPSSDVSAFWTKGGRHSRAGHLGADVAYG